jgi:hypothetical protein
MPASVPFTWYTKPYYSHFYTTKKSYYENFHKIVDVDLLLAAALPGAGQFLKAACGIQILGVPFDATPGVVSKLLGLPNFKHDYGGRATYFYKRSFFRDKAIFQFNFLGELFTSCVVTFIQRKNSREGLFLRIIREKYLSEKDRGLKLLPGIMDGGGHLLLFDDSVYSSLIYVNAARVLRDIGQEMDEKVRQISLLNWKKHYDNWSENL